MSQDTNEGFSEKEILVRLEGKFDAHVIQYNADRVSQQAVYQADQLKVHTALVQRPTRVELIRWMGGMLAAAGVLSGIVFRFLGG